MLNLPPTPYNIGPTNLFIGPSLLGVQDRLLDFVKDIWEFSHNLNIYDCCYVYREENGTTIA